ncbi:hypothetical protein LCGC14_0952050 [marine sediment metagenome]|uniref:Uncharacterized protein n=1 Tax=marine sediment metagenome TaxID=412755 RepID=A0A0F9R0F6_9ZZZZ
MTNRNVEGPAHSLLKDNQKHVCEFCNGSLFQLVDNESDENTDLPADTKAYLWENSVPTLPYANMQTLKLLCTCGKISGKLLFCFDLVSASTTPALTMTHIACVTTVNNLAGLYLTPIGAGATNKGVSYKILSNTVADPTIITVDGAINDDVAGDIVMISSWQVF